MSPGSSAPVRSSRAPHPLVYVLVLNWNGKRHLRGCLDSLLQVDYPNFRTLMIDNDSVDDSVAFVRERYPQIEIIANKKNVGFAEGNNIGIRRALSKDAQYVVLLNNDTKVDRRWLSELVETAERKQHAGILGSKVLIYNNPKIVNTTGIHMNYYGYGWDRDFAEHEEEIRAASGPVLGVSGVAVLIRRQVLEEIGLLDPSYFAYYEDLDLCIRTWIRTRYTVEYVSSAVVYHKFSATSGRDSFRKHYLMARNHYRIVGKFYPVGKLAHYVPRILIHRMRTTARALLMSLRLREFLAEVFLMAWFLTTLPWLKLRGVLQTRGGSCAGVWRMLIPTDGFPFHRELPEEYARIGVSRHEITEAPARILMGINDDLLGDGWLPLVHEIPRYRRFTGRASCLLKNSHLFDRIQIHCMCEADAEALLLVFVEGELVASRTIHHGWMTHVIPFTNSWPDAVLELSLEVTHRDSGDTPLPSIGVNEIGMLPATSRLLRADAVRPHIRHEEARHA